MSDAELAERERLARKYRDSHFSLDGAMDQVGKLLAGGASDITCRRLPQRNQAQASGAVSRVALPY